MKSGEVRQGSEGNQCRVCHHTLPPQATGVSFQWGTLGASLEYMPQSHPPPLPLLGEGAKVFTQHLSVIGRGMLGWCWEGPGPLQATERAPAARKALRQRGASAGGWASLPGNGGDREDVGQDSEASASGLQLILVQKFLGGSRAVIAKLGSLRVPVLDSSPYLS